MWMIQHAHAVHLAIQASSPAPDVLRALRVSNDRRGRGHFNDAAAVVGIRFARARCPTWLRYWPGHRATPTHRLAFFAIVVIVVVVAAAAVTAVAARAAMGLLSCRLWFPGADAVTVGCRC